MRAAAVVDIDVNIHILPSKFKRSMVGVAVQKTTFTYLLYRLPRLLKAYKKRRHSNPK